VDTDARNMSRRYCNTIGEIGTAASGGVTVDGRGYKIYESPAELRMVSVYAFVADIEDNATARFDLGTILAKKISRPAIAHLRPSLTALSGPSGLNRRLRLP